MKKKYFMGISGLHHDSAVALIDNRGNIINVSQEERRTGIKNDKSWPINSIKWSIENAQAQGYDVSEKNISYVYYEKPWSKFSRRAQTNPKKVLEYFKEACIPDKNIFGIKKVSHHFSHALAACATAPFDKGLYLTVDAIGEWETTTWGIFNQKAPHDRSCGIKQLGSIAYPDSIGLLYSAFTRWLGLKPNEEEYIVMGAAAYGVPRFVPEILDEFVHIEDNGIFVLKKDIHHGVEQYLGYEVPVEDWYDWAASIQNVCELLMYCLVKNIWYSFKDKQKQFNLVLGGGVALNCVNNSKLLRKLPIENIWILPSPGDSGNALGAAAYAARLSKLNWTTPYLGDDIDFGSNPTEALIRDVVARLDRGELVGWIQGREEFGPRALGHRSILADPRNPQVREKVNSIKQREKFRPFAPAVLEERAFSYFDMPGKPEFHRYMQFVSRVRNPSALPAITHIDNSARVQTVPKSTDPFRRLLEHWEQSTGCAVLLNTSLNERSKPLVSNRKDALKLLLDSNLDVLVIGNRLYYKEVKLGLSEDGSPVTIANCIDYGNGVDNIVERPI